MNQSEDDRKVQQLRRMVIAQREYDRKVQQYLEEIRQIRGAEFTQKIARAIENEDLIELRRLYEESINTLQKAQEEKVELQKIVSILRRAREGR